MGGVSLRGVIQHAERARQLNDFSGLIHGSITPTDIDGLVEYQDKAYVLHEVKYLDKRLPYGQRRAIEIMMDDFTKAGKKALAMVIEHSVTDTSQSVPVGLCPVRVVYFGDNGRWQRPQQRRTAAEMQRAFLDYVDGKFEP